MEQYILDSKTREKIYTTYFSMNDDEVEADKVKWNSWETYDNKNNTQIKKEIIEIIDKVLADKKKDYDDMIEELSK